MAIAHVVLAGMDSGGGTGTIWLPTRGYLPVVPGPYCFEEVDFFIPGAVETDDFIPGYEETGDFIPGAAETDDFVPGTEETDDFIPGAEESQEGCC